MTTYAYLRISTDEQDVDNQRYGLFLYANTHGLGPLQFVEDTASGRLAWRDRAVGRLLTETVRAGDAVLFAEISRMARSTLQVLEMLEHCMRQGVSVHIAKQQLVLDGSIQSRITATVLGLAAEIEREMISLRTYLVLGVEHILTGIDHLLFVLALILITRGGWKVVKTVTAFTLSHSITLTAATLGFVHVPQRPVEAVIALSIVFVAAEILHSRQGRIGVTTRERNSVCLITSPFRTHIP
jgi:hypothetical protein